MAAVAHECIFRGDPVAKLAQRHGAPVLEVAHVCRGAVLVGFRPAHVYQDADAVGGVLHGGPSERRRFAAP